MVQIEHIRAWLGTSLGHLLMSITLTPPDEPDALGAATLQRLAIPLQVAPSSPVNEFEERNLDLLYNLSVTPTGLSSSDIRVGQGERMERTLELAKFRTWRGGDARCN
jgi:hypothetical protein